MVVFERQGVNPKDERHKRVCPRNPDKASVSAGWNSLNTLLCFEGFAEQKKVGAYPFFSGSPCFFGHMR